MSTKTAKNSMALGAAAILGVAGAVVITTSSPSSAMPVLAKTTAVSIAAPNPVTDVHYYRHGYRRRHGYHRHGYYRHGYYGGGYGYPYGGYSYPYAYPYAYSYPFSFGWGWGGW